MPPSPSKPSPSDNKNLITILLVDDIAETRENIKKLLAFEPDFKVVGSAGTGREGVELAKELRPDIIIMDINMPDMDGLQATGLITKALPAVGVIMMSVQTDTDYIRKAMRAGARSFLGKPINMDELYDTVRSVYNDLEDAREREKAIKEGQVVPQTGGPKKPVGERAGNIIVVYSPQGGAGTTTIATSLASGLMKEGIRVLLVDADLQFGDVGVFLNLQAQSTLLDLSDNVDDLDTELFENIVTTHDSGLKVLMGPPRPELADEVIAKPETVAKIIEKIAGSYDFIVVDTASHFDAVLLPLLDMSTRVVLVGTPTLTSIKNVRFVLDLFDQLGYSQDKVCLVLNRVWDPRQGKQVTLAPDRIQNYLKRQVISQIPLVDERVILSAVNKGVPVIASDRDQSKAPIRQLLDLSEFIYNALMGVPEEEADADAQKQQKKKLGILGR